MATILSNSTSLSDVSLAVSQSNPGDTVLIPAGTGNWSSGLTISKSITLQGSGSNQTIINRASGFTGSLIFIGNLPTDVPVRVTNIYFDAITVGQSGWLSTIYIQNANPATFGYSKIRIDNCTFHGGQGVIFWKNWCFGVVDHCKFNNCVYAGAMYSDGDNAWTKAGTYQYGTGNAVFWENNTFTMDTNVGYMDTLFDHDMGATSVFRYNKFDLSAYSGSSSFGSLITMHGNQAYWTGVTDNVRGTVGSEIYNNTFLMYSCYRMIWPRGGRNLIANNTITLTTGSIGAMVAFSEEEGSVTSFFNPLRSTWPAEDQINNTFIWSNTVNGSAQSPGSIYCWDQASNTFIQVNRDYWLQQPGTSTVTTYPRPGSPSSSSYPVPYNPPVTSWTAFTYPHPLITAPAPTVQPKLVPLNLHVS